MQFLVQLYALSKRNIILRYKHSLIGFLWGFIKPLIYLFIFIIIFSAQFSDVSHYVLYATSGIIFWFFFSNIVSQGIQSFVLSAGIIKSVQIPMVLFPLAEVITELFNLVLALGVYFIIMPWYGLHSSFVLLWLIPALALFALFAFSIALLLATLNVYFRDIGILWNTIQPAIFYLTPIAYTETLIPSRFAFVIRLNPIYHFIQLLRAPIYKSCSPSPLLWLHCSEVTIVVLLFALFVFHQLKNQFITSL